MPWPYEVLSRQTFYFFGKKKVLDASVEIKFVRCFFLNFLGYEVAFAAPCGTRHKRQTVELASPSSRLTPLNLFLKSHLNLFSPPLPALPSFIFYRLIKAGQAAGWKPRYGVAAARHRQQ